MRFPYVALAIMPSANDSTYITLVVVFKMKYFMGHIKGICIFLSNMYLIVSHKSILSVPNANLFAFSDPTQLAWSLKTNSVIRA